MRHHNTTKSLRQLSAPALALMVAASTWSCAVNPATGRSEFSLVSEAQEIAIGTESDRAIVAQYGLYPDEEWQAYVQELGARLAASSERPDLPWTFRVLDDPLVNAFALPGGFIYVTRGILAHLDSEAELVGVLGHEIGHVTARHGASRMSKAMLAQLGLGIGSILAPEAAQSIGGLAMQATQLLFLKYGRDDERQADALGVRYSLREGFDPSEMVGVFATLGRVSAAAGGSGLPNWASTHPTPENRTELIEARLAELRPPGELRINRDGFLRRLDGIVYGSDPRQGFFVDDLFVHPEMAFQLRFPKGWQTSNSRQAVTALSPEEDAIMQLSLANGDSARAAAEQFFAQEGIDRGSRWSSGYSPEVGQGFSVDNEAGATMIDGWVTFTDFGETTLQLLGYAQASVSNRRGRTLRPLLRTLQPLRNGRWKNVEPLRLEVVSADRSGDVSTVGSLRSDVPEREVALINGLDDGQRVEKGALVKRVRGFDIRSVRDGG